MKYIKVEWIHNYEDEPTTFYSEIDEHRFEKRQISIFRDGSAFISTESNNFGGPGLSPLAIPSMDEISSEPEFIPTEISEEEFNKTWRIASLKLRKINQD